jgi:tRNA(fMet)-specific endonuclease VapC
MADYLLDTNHLSPLVTFDHPLRQTLIDQLRHSHTFSIAAPVLTEFLFGIQTLPRAVTNLQEWQKYQNAFKYYDIDRADAEQAATLQLELRRRGRQLHTVDALIAAVALRYQLILLTTDQDFQALNGLAQENWVTGAALAPHGG